VFLRGLEDVEGCGDICLFGSVAQSDPHSVHSHTRQIPGFNVASVRSEVISLFIVTNVLMFFLVITQF
jgi:hypothetical protein